MGWSAPPAGTARSAVSWCRSVPVSGWLLFKVDFDGSSFYGLLIFFLEIYMLFLFQLSLFAFVALSLVLIVGVPVAFASPDGWASSKNIVFSGATAWIFLLFIVGILNSFVV